MRSVGSDSGIIALYSLSLVLSLSSARAQDAIPTAPKQPAPGNGPSETYRLRVENMVYGRIEASADEGKNYTLIGRVLHPAKVATLDKTAETAGVVVRSVPLGVAFAVGPGLMVKLRPYRPAAAKTVKQEPSSLLTDVPSGSGVFGDLLPPAGSTVRLQIGSRTPAQFTESYMPNQEDSFLFTIRLSLPPSTTAAGDSDDQRRHLQRGELVKRLESLGRAYTDGAQDRARAEKRHFVSGILTLRAKLPAGEPEPITAMTYSIDGDVVAAQNVIPFSYGWDTRRVPDGEHLVEMRGLSQYATVVTRVRALVFVKNGPALR